MPMTDDEIRMLRDIVERIRGEYASIITVEMVRAGWSRSRIRQVLKNAADQVAVIDDEMIRIAFSDFEEAADRLEVAS
jgi:DNA replication initiation complex subunit (GINS family)